MYTQTHLYSHRCTHICICIREHIFTQMYSCIHKHTNIFQRNLDFNYKYIKLEYLMKASMGTAPHILDELITEKWCITLPNIL